MWQRIIYIIILINSLNSLSESVPISEYNETNLLLSINSQLKQLIHQKIQETESKLDNQLLRTDFQSLRADFQSLRADFQSLRADLQQRKDEPNNKLQNQSIKCEGDESKNLELEQQLTDGFCNKSNSDICTKVKSNGVYDILIHNFSCKPFKVVCDTKRFGGGWTIILKRLDGSVDFYRNWTEYKNGFGNLDGEFFLGLDKINALTTESAQQLIVIVEDWRLVEKFETYDEFAIGDESQQYKLNTLGKANGTAGDSLSYHRGMKFSTRDRDNDLDKTRNCAEGFTGAWWYNNCLYSNLAGNYQENGIKGIVWAGFRAKDYSHKKAIMMIRPKQYMP